MLGKTKPAPIFYTIITKKENITSHAFGKTHGRGQ